MRIDIAAWVGIVLTLLASSFWFGGELTQINSRIDNLETNQTSLQKTMDRMEQEQLRQARK